MLPALTGGLLVSEVRRGAQFLNPSLIMLGHTAAWRADETCTKIIPQGFTEEDRNNCLASVAVLFSAVLVFFSWLEPAIGTDVYLAETKALYGPPQRGNLDGVSGFLPHKEILKETITRIALEYHVDPRLALFMAEQESTFRPDALGDMHIICPHTGKPVRSRGLYQISECYHPEFTDADAFEPEKNIRKAMEIVSEGKINCISQFSSCRKYYSINR